jgi:hypothetical protein
VLSVKPVLFDGFHNLWGTVVNIFDDVGFSFIAGQGLFNMPVGVTDGELVVLVVLSVFHDDDAVTQFFSQPDFLQYSPDQHGIVCGLELQLHINDDECPLSFHILASLP